MSQPNTMSHLYNPANQSNQQLVDGFVIRKKEFKRLVSDLATDDFDCAAQHFLIEGQRGTGKTSLLLRIRYEIENNDEFKHLLVVQFAEEQYNIFDLCRLWESTAEALDQTEGFESISDEMDEHVEDDDYVIECFSFIEKQLIKYKKRLVLLLDNFGDILNRFSELEQKRLRDIFHNSNHIQIIASSAQALEDTYKHDKPFFEFFKIINLTGLNKKDVNILMQRLAEHNSAHTKNVEHIIKTQPQRLETIRRLTGGIPRTIVLLFEIFADESANVFEDLEQILDRVTPLYKHRMDDLPTQQQAIVDTIALSWDGITTKEIVHALKKRGFNSKTVSAQLVSMTKSGFVESKNIDKKNKLYFVRERFFNIWYLMRYGRKKNKDQVKWLVRFLEQWCSADELVSRAKSHIKCARAGTLNSRGGYYMAEALAGALSDRDVQHELLIETRKALRKYNPNIDSELSKSDQEISEMAAIYYIDGKFKLATKSYKILADRGDVNSMFYMALICVAEYKAFDTAIKYYKMAIEKDNASAMFNLAILYVNEYKDFDTAINYYKMAIEKCHVKAMSNLAFLYKREYKDFDTAIKYYKMAIEKGSVNAMNNLAFLYESEYKDFDAAIKYYKMAIEKSHVKAMSNLAFLYESEYKDFDVAIKYYKMAVEKGDSRAIFNLADLYESEYKDFDEAIKYYKMAIEKGDVNSMNGLAWLYYSINTNKTESLDLIEKSHAGERSFHSSHSLATILLWNDRYQESLEKIHVVIEDDKQEDFSDDMTDYFLLLLSKKQYHCALELFEQYEKLKNQLKPVYYALMTLLKDEYPKEWLKMGSELEDTVAEILVEIENKPQK